MHLIKTLWLHKLHVITMFEPCEYLDNEAILLHVIRAGFLLQTSVYTCTPRCRFTWETGNDIHFAASHNKLYNIVHHKYSIKFTIYVDPLKKFGTSNFLPPFRYVSVRVVRSICFKWFTLYMECTHTLAAC